MKISQLKQIIREEIENFSNEPFTKKELQKLKPNDEFIVDNGAGLFKNKSVVLSNTRQELKFKSNIPGIGWQLSSLLYKNFNDSKNLWFDKKTNSIYRFYPTNN